MLSSSPLFQLYLVRLRDFYRQPARVFWVYGFPTIMAIVLGFAFRNRPPAPIEVDLVKKSGSAEVKSAVQAHNAALASAKSAGKPRLNVPLIELHEASADETSKRLRNGRTPLVIEPKGPRSSVYHFDPTRPDASAARLILDDVLERAQGRADLRDSSEVYVTEPGSRYIDFLIPG